MAQEDFAKRIDVSQSYLSTMERGEVEIGGEILLRITTGLVPSATPVDFKLHPSRVSVRSGIRLYVGHFVSKPTHLKGGGSYALFAEGLDSR